MEREATSMLDGWLGAVERAEECGFEELPCLDSLPPHVRSESEFWCDEILTPAANPHDAVGAKHRICRSSEAPLDLIRHDLRVGGMGVSVIEGRNFVIVKVDRASLDLLSVPDHERPAAVARAASALFRAPLDFAACASLDEGSMICTNTGADPALLSSWASRADGVIRGGELWFVCYKKCPSRVGFANACQWFSDDGSIRPAARRGARRARQRP